MSPGVWAIGGVPVIWGMLTLYFDHFCKQLLLRLELLKPVLENQLEKKVIVYYLIQ